MAQNFWTVMLKKSYNACPEGPKLGRRYSPKYRVIPVSYEISLEIKNKLITSCIGCVTPCGSETWTLGKNEKRVINAFQTGSCRSMLKIKWADRIMNNEVFQGAKEERSLLKILKNRRHSWIGHIIRHNEVVVNITEGAISGKMP